MCDAGCPRADCGRAALEREDRLQRVRPCGRSSRNGPGFPKLSRYDGDDASSRRSFSQYSRRSFEETSALFPSETKADRPSPRSRAPSTTASPSAPLCDAKPTSPGGSPCAANVAFRWAPVAAMPRQFGPISAAAVRAHEREQRGLARGALVPGLGEAGRDDAQRAHARPSASATAQPHRRRGNADHGEVDERPDAAQRSCAPALPRLPRPLRLIGWAAPAKPASSTLRKSSPPIVAAPRRGAVDGNAREARERGGATRLRQDGSRRSTRSSKAPLGLGAHRDLDHAAVARAARTRARSRRRARASHGCSGRISKTRRSTPAPAARSPSCSSRRVPTPTPCKLLGDGERHLGRRGITQAVVAREADDGFPAAPPSRPINAPRSLQSGRRKPARSARREG